ncbi:hypothetical protein KUTeg_003983 [Tegillarca granosa]|uniref:Uncharacterized protein n=1 Tax=Tegillarca granosa TaxID=220873 RepID=A0ABQ9FNP4_TEGGR|nr:hypothetical protein KUTeg_003983 [Tegillarca granosa]
MYGGVLIVLKENKKMKFILYVLLSVILSNSLYFKVNGQNNTVPPNQQNAVTSGTSEELSPLEKGVQTFYDIVHNFLDSVQKDDFVYSGGTFNLTTLEEIFSKSEYSRLQQEWQQVASVFSGFAACIVVGLLFIIFMPIAGCCWCCCYCCCKRCGKAKSKDDPPYAKCKRSTCCVLLFVVAVMMLAGAIVASISNEILHQKLENTDNKGPVGKLNTSFKAIEQYAASTVVEIQTKTNRSLSRTTAEIKQNISNAVTSTVDAVQKEIKSDTLLHQTEQLGKDASDIKSKLDTFNTTLNRVNKLNTDIQSKLKEVSDNITAVCPTGCLDVSSLSTNTDFTNVGDLQDIASNLGNALNIENLTSTAKSEFENIKRNVTNKIETKINDSLNQVDNITAEVQSKLEEVNKTVQPFIDSINKEVNPKLSDLDEFFKTNGDYWWYAGIGTSCLILLVVLFYLLSMLFGVFGERPGHGAQCCNKGAANNFIVAGVVCSFLFAWILMLLVLILFTIGGMSYILFCRNLNNGVENIEKYEVIVESVASVSLKSTLYGDKNVDISIGSVLRDCKNNMALYSALKLENKFDLQQLLDVSQVTKEVDKIRNQGFLEDIGNIQIIPTDLQDQLNNFASSGIGTVNFTQYDEQFNKNVINFDFTATINNLKRAENSSRNSDEAAAIRAQREALEDLNQNEINWLRGNITNLNTSISNLRDKTNILNVTNSLIASLETAQKDFNNNGKTIVNNTMQATLNSIVATITREASDLVNMITNDTGKCRQVYDSAQDITDAICITILDPLNGFWFGMGWALFFYIPCIIFGLCLGNLYQRENRYDKEEARRKKRQEQDFDSPDMEMYHGGGGYNGYHGSSSDNVPLTGGNLEGMGIIRLILFLTFNK